MTEDGRKHNRELDALYSIARILSGQSGQREIPTAVLETLEREMSMRRGTIMLASPDDNELRIEVAPGIKRARQIEVRYQRGEGVTGRVLMTGRSAVIPRIFHEPGFKNRIYGRRDEGARELSFICVPIVLGKEIVGTLGVDLPFEGDRELSERERFLSIVAAMIANDVMARRRASALP